MKPQAHVLLWSNYFWSFSTGLLGPLFAVFTERIGGDIFDIAWVWSVYLVATGVGIVAVGYLADWLRSHRLFCVIGYAIETIAMFSYLAVGNPYELMMVQILHAIGLSFNTPAWAALFDHYSGSGKKDGVMWGLSYGGWYIFQGAAIFCGGLIVTHYSFDALFVLMGIVMFFATLTQALLLKRSLK